MTSIVAQVNDILKKGLKDISSKNVLINFFAHCDIDQLIDIYDKLHKLTNEVLYVKLIILEIFWNTNHKNYNIEKFDYIPDAIECESIWLDFLNKDNINKLNITTNYALQLLLIKMPDLAKTYSYKYHLYAKPLTIVKYVKAFPEYQEHLANFKYLTPQVFQELNRSPIENEVLTMITNFPYLIDTIFDIYKGAMKIEFLNAYIESFLENKFIEIKDDYVQHLCAEIYDICHLETKRVNSRNGITHFVDVATKILGYKVIPDDDTFKLSCRVKSIDLLRLLIENGFCPEKRHIMIAAYKKLSLHEITDVQLDEDSYFELYLDEVNVSDIIKMFKPELQKQIELRSLFTRGIFSEAIKFMKKYNLRPDRYCMDAAYNATGNSKKTFMTIVNQYDCIAVSSISYLQDIKYGDSCLSAQKIRTICEKNGINAEYMSVKY